jgi:hypothetical protein
MLAMVWHVHVKFFRRYGLETLWASVLNSVLLFVLLFYVYPLKFLFTFLMGMFTGGALLPHTPGNAPMMGSLSNVQSLMVIYGLGFAAVFLILFLLYRHAWGLRQELELNEIETHLTQYEMMNQFAMMCFGLASAVIATLVPPRMAGLAGYLYGGIGLYHFIAGWIMSARSEKILTMMQQRESSSAVEPVAPPPVKAQAAPKV